MSSNIQTTNFVSKLNNANFDLAYLTSAWSNVAYDGNRILAGAGQNEYYFPAPFQGTETAVIGQVVTIFNQSSNSSLQINTGNMTVRFGNTTYTNFQNFTINRLNIVSFVLLYTGYYVEIVRNGM